MVVGFRDYAQQLKPSLDAAFSFHLSRVLGDARASDPDDGASMLTDGKKIRGCLLCLVTAALGGALERALPRAAAVELIQTASLIHDDFVDQHRTRRGRPALWIVEDARKAVLLGDVIFASAIDMMSALGNQDGRIAAQAIAEIARGAYQEPLDPAVLVAAIEADRITGALYERIIYLKTAALFGAACQLGAVAADAQTDVQQTWLRYGVKVGEAYQLADDLQEVEQLLGAPSMDARVLASLAPALLCFAPEIRPALADAARRPSAALHNGLHGHLRAAARAMNAEVERRLRAAVCELDGNLAAGPYARLAREAPQALIRMFNEASAQAPAP